MKLGVDTQGDLKHDDCWKETDRRQTDLSMLDMEELETMTIGFNELSKGLSTIDSKNPNFNITLRIVIISIKTKKHALPRGLPENFEKQTPTGVIFVTLTNL